MLQAKDFFSCGMIFRHDGSVLPTFLPLVNSFASKCTIPLIVYVSLLLYIHIPPQSPSSVSIFYHYPCHFLCHISVPLFRLFQSTLPFSVFVPHFSPSTPLLNGYWPAAYYGKFLHMFIGNMFSYLLKIHHTADFCPLFSGSHSHACSHFQRTDMHIT